MIFTEKFETMGRDELRRVQGERLREAAQRAYDKVPFYRKKFDAHGVCPQDIQTIDDIVKLKARKGVPIAGAVLGRALYNGAISPQEALKVAA